MAEKTLTSIFVSNSCIAIQSPRLRFEYITLTISIRQFKNPIWRVVKVFRETNPEVVFFGPCARSMLNTPKKWGVATNAYPKCCYFNHSLTCSFKSKKAVSYKKGGVYNKNQPPFARPKLCLHCDHT